MVLIPIKADFFDGFIMESGSTFRLDVFSGIINFASGKIWIKEVKKMKNSKLKITIFLALVFLIPCHVVFGGSGELEVCPFDCQFEKLSEAVDYASPGSTIRLKEGNYLENVVVDKDLLLKGRPDTESALKGYNVNKPTLKIGPSDVDVKIENMTFSKGGIGLNVVGEANVTLKECVFSYNKKGIVVEGASELKIIDCTIKENRIERIKGVGIVIRGSSNVVIRDSIVLRNTEGIKVGGLSSLKVYESAISGNVGLGLLAEGSPDVYLEGNEFIDSYIYGIALNTGECGFREQGETFTGTISGKKNSFINAGIEFYCPAKLSFLAEEEEGKYSGGSS